MKKSLFFVAAASALMLTACSSENDVVQSPTNQNTVAVQQQAVGFDVYTPAATNVTRAGLEGTMTTSHMQRSEYEGGGFGVYSFQVQDNTAAGNMASSYLDLDGDGTKSNRTTPVAPNFMVNEKLLWNAESQGWYYNPLKYWPNETNNDSQNTNATMLGDGTNSHIDRLTFFAYAPYVATADPAKVGINYVTNNAGKLATGATAADATLSSDPNYQDYNSGVKEPSVAYTAEVADPNKSVDLLWGVAPAGGINYTAVNGKTVTVEEGKPLMDMTKPDINTSMKFLFQHALARIGVTAVAAVDQVGAGGKLDPNTKITIEKIQMTGWFGQTGILNLDNEKANVANWRFINGVDLTTKSAATGVATNSGDVFKGITPTTLTLVADHTANTEYADNNVDLAYHQKGTIARHLQFVNKDNSIPNQEAVSEPPVAQTNRIGVTTVRQNVIMPALIDNAPGAGHNRPWHTSKSYAANELKYSESTPYYTNDDCTTQAVATVYNNITTPQAVDATHNVYTVNDRGVYYEHKQGITLKYPQVNNYYNVTFKEVVETSASAGQILRADVTGKNYQAYTKTQYVSDGTPNEYRPKAVGLEPAVGDYVIVGEITKAAAAYADATTYYKRDNNYFMVVPLNNVPNLCTSLDAADLKELYTVRVKIEYYITTTDSKLAGGLAQTKNVITKDVVFPGIANGKSYNLNLILGLTSVKMEAEVDDWKVVNVNGDLPQNTSGE